MKSSLMAVAAFLVRYLVVALMFSIGMAARPADLSPIWRQPRRFVKPLLVMEVGVPLLALATIAIIPLTSLATELLLLMAVCPGAPFIPKAARHGGETHSSYALCLLVIVALLAPVTVPLWVAIIDRVLPYDHVISPAAIARKIVPLILAPLFVAMVVRRGLPRRIADLLARAADLFVKVAMVVAIALALYLGAPVLLQVRPATLLAVLVIVAGSAWMGYRAGPPHDPVEDRATGVAAALGNPGLVFAIVAATYPGFQATAGVAAFLIARKLALMPFEWWVSRRASHGRPAPTGALPTAPGAG